MSDLAALIARFDTAKANPGGSGVEFVRAYRAAEHVKSVALTLAAAESDLAAAQKKAEIAAEWAEYLPDDAKNAADLVAECAARVASMREMQARAEAQAKGDISMWLDGLDR